MAIKLIAVDLDGTLLNSGNAISPETLRTLQVAHGMGIKVVLASGRPLSGVMPFENQLGLEGSEEYAVVFNGAVVQDLSGKVLMSQEMDYRDFEVMLRLQRLAHVNLHFETTERFWTLDRDLSVQMQINAALTDNEIRVVNGKKFRKTLPSIKLALLVQKIATKLKSSGILFLTGPLNLTILFVV